MAIDTKNRQKVDYFTGIEVENTCMKGRSTLFVVGVKPVYEIIELLEKHNNTAISDLKINHVYLGTSQSFNPETYEDWRAWDTMISGLLENGLWVTLDFDVKYADEFHEDGWTENNRFIPMISVKLPYIKLFNYNTTLKLDDKTWGATNSGVWCHSLHNLMSRSAYTDWYEYTEDTPINQDKK